MSKIIDANLYEEELVEYAANVIATMKDKIKRAPKLVIIHANSEEASKRYINNKIKMGEKLGIEVEYVFFEHEENVEDKILAHIELLNNDHTVDGIIVQLPVYAIIDKTNVLQAISVKKDVDGLNPANLGMLKVLGETNFVPCTPLGVLSMLDTYGYGAKYYEGKNAVVVGRGETSGDPMATLLQQLNATVTVCHSRTRKKDLERYIKNADIVISCVGKRGLLNASWFKEGAIVVGVGFEYDENCKQHLDFEFDEVVELDKVEAVSKRVNCTGKATVLSLMLNTLTAYYNSIEHIKH